jgi:DNA-binding PadR family transcriptional regulator
VDAEWRSTDSARRARYYALTRAGRRRLDAETSDWKRRSAAIVRLLKAEG